MRTEFEIIYAKNPEIYQCGFIEFDDDEIEWSYYDQNGFRIYREFTHHDGVELSATEEQNNEIDRFLEVIHVDLVDYIQDIICTAEEDEHETYKKDDIIIKINGGNP